MYDNENVNEAVEETEGGDKNGKYVDVPAPAAGVVVGVALVGAFTIGKKLWKLGCEFVEFVKQKKAGVETTTTATVDGEKTNAEVMEKKEKDYKEVETDSDKKKK